MQTSKQRDSGEPPNCISAEGAEADQSATRLSNSADDKRLFTSHKIKFAYDDSEPEDEDDDEEAKHSDDNLQRQIQRAYIENIIGEDSVISAGSVVRADQAAHSGDEFGGQNVAEDLPKKPYEKCLSQLAQTASHQSPFPPKDKPRRSSEQEAALTYSQHSHWKLQNDSRDYISTNFYVSSADSEQANSTVPVHEGSSGYNLSDGALCRTAMPQLAPTRQAHVKGSVSVQHENSQHNSPETLSHLPLSEQQVL